MLRPFVFLFGYRRLRVLRASAGEVMNIFRVSGYTWRDFEFCGDYACFSCSAPVSHRIIEACKARGISVYVERESGIPFILKRYRHRYGFFIGMALCALLIFASSLLVWDIRVEGNERLSEDEVIAKLSECGFSVGAWKKDVDIDATEARVIVYSDDISWISINLLGTVANVEIRETEQIPDNGTAEYAAANLVAARGGVIEDFRNVRGEVVARIGDIVGEGDLLVSGLYGDESSSFRYTCAKGEVLARTWRSFSVEIPLAYKEKSYKNTQKCEKYLIFFKKEVKFTINSGNLPPTCDTIDTVEYLSTPWGTRLPVGIRTVRYLEYEEREAVRTEAEAEALAEYKLRLIYESELKDAELISKSIFGALDGDGYILRAEIEAIENIAVVKEIEIEGLP